jgi:acyl-coenzyme A thioesterase PaaI-like protein
MSTQEVLDNIKYVAWHSIEVVRESPGSVTLRLPARNDLVNYVGTGHAGAIYTLAETAAGVTADGAAQTLNAFILLGGAVVSYTRRAEGDLLATGVVESAAGDQAQELFLKESRADMPVEVNICDDQDKSVFHGTFNYALRPRN